MLGNLEKFHVVFGKVQVEKSASQIGVAAVMVQRNVLS